MNLPDCECQSCRNFAQAAPSFPKPAVDFFHSLGADITKPAEVWDYGDFRGNLLLYGGIFHIVGKINIDSVTNQPEPQRKRFWFFRSRQADLPKQMSDMVSLAEGFEVYVTNSLDMLPDGFPEPAVQMEISFWVPWVLKEPYLE